MLGNLHVMIMVSLQLIGGHSSLQCHALHKCFIMLILHTLTDAISVRVLSEPAVQVLVVDSVADVFSLWTKSAEVIYCGFKLPSCEPQPWRLTNLVEYFIHKTFSVNPANCVIVILTNILVSIFYTSVFWSVLIVCVIGTRSCFNVCWLFCVYPPRTADGNELLAIIRHIASLLFLTLMYFYACPVYNKDKKLLKIYLKKNISIQFLH